MRLHYFGSPGGARADPPNELLRKKITADSKMSSYNSTVLCVFLNHRFLSKSFMCLAEKSHTAQYILSVAVGITALVMLLSPSSSHTPITE